MYDADEEHDWIVSIMSCKYMIDGKGGKLSKSNVVDAGTLTTTPTGCVDVD